MKSIVLSTYVACLILAAGMAVPSAEAVPLLGNLTNQVEGTSEFHGNPDSGDEFVTGGAPLDITSIDVLWRVGNGSTANRVGMFTDAGGLPSGTQVGTWFTSGLATDSDTVINYVGTAILLANTVYHLLIDTLDLSYPAWTDDPSFVADTSTLGASNPLGTSWGDIQTVTWTEDPANLMWQLNRAPVAVPEPATLTLIGCSVLGLLGWRQTKRANRNG